MITTTYTAADFCQGHGGGRECNFHPESGDCDHGYDFDHGVISYCDGSCPEAREHYFRHVRNERGTLPSPSTSTIWLEAYGSSVSYLVAFEGPQAEARALAYISSHKGLAFQEVYDRPFAGRAYATLAEALNPTCHHGLSLSQCMDPIGDAHFGTRDWEMSRGW